MQEGTGRVGVGIGVVVMGRVGSRGGLRIGVRVGSRGRVGVKVGLRARVGMGVRYRVGVIVGNGASIVDRARSGLNFALGSSCVNSWAADYRCQLRNASADCNGVSINSSL